MAENNATYAPQVDEGQVEAASGQKKSSGACKFLPLLMGLALVGGAVVGLLYALDAGPFSDSNSSSGSGGGSDGGGGGSKDRPSECPTVAAGERMVMFWQSEVGGCDDIPDGVTHVAWGFAEVEKDTSKIIPEFQGNKDTLKACIKTLRERCIFSIASVGGANNVPEMATINDPDVFADSLLDMIKDYDFDGIDIDDETVGDEYDEDRVVAYMRAVSKKLKSDGNDYILTWDGLVYAGDDSYCQDPARQSYSRCYPTEVTSLVDWIHILAYNVADVPADAAAFYDSATSDTFPKWIEKIGDSKANFGICVPGGCAFGPGPSDSVISSWTKYGLDKGGMMIYTGSAEADSFTATKLIIEEQGKP